MDKKKKRTGPVPPDLVTTAWIVSTLGVHQSSIEPAWRRGELDVFAQVLGGRKKTRPVFRRTDAEEWASARADRLEAMRRDSR